MRTLRLNADSARKRTWCQAFNEDETTMIMDKEAERKRGPGKSQGGDQLKGKLEVRADKKEKVQGRRR